MRKKAVGARISLLGDADSLPLCDPFLLLRFYKVPIKHVNQLFLYMNVTFFLFPAACEQRYDKLR